MSDAALIESILYPSKKIKKGYETSVVLTIDGETYNGMIVNKDDQQWVLRDRANIDQLVTIPKEEIESTRPGKLSSMPDQLADQLKDRRQFLDLLRYVFELRERGPAKSGSTKSQAVQRRLSPVLEGHVAIEKFSCTKCHRAEDSLYVSKEAPRLDWSARHLNPDYLKKYIANPHQVKPGSTMPDLMGNLNDAFRERTAEFLTQYLISKTGNVYTPQRINSEAVARGNELFHSIGCVACHSPRDDRAKELDMLDSTPMGDLSQKYDLASLVEFLENPLKVRSSGHMPSMKLLRRESTDVASYLLQSVSTTESNWKPDLTKVAKGKELFESLNCAACHDTLDPTIQPQGSKFAFQDLVGGKGCVAEAKSGVEMPRFQMDALERESIAVHLKQANQKLSNEDKISISLRRLNCLACHQRNELGGVSIDRNPHFKTTNLNLGDQGRIPPTLTRVGAKLNSKWLRDVMVNGRSIRPYMKTRMPQFGESNVKQLFELFDRTDRLSTPTEYVKFKDQKKMRETGLQLAGNRGLNCVACHTYKFRTADTMPAVDLTEMTERLKKDWFYQYMLDPQRFSPNTVMPSFWPNGKAIRSDLSGTPEEQIEALWQYLIDGRQARSPRGVIREPLEIVVQDEARMLRRAYPNIGKRGIGVGYPGGINIAFDAEQMRLGLLWRGRFADPGGVWRGQGSGQVRPMSRPISFVEGPEVDSATEPWVADNGRPPNHRFKGYSLDQKQRPTFRYEFGSIAVEDFFQEIRSTGDSTESAKVLRRTITFTSTDPIDDLRFRVATKGEQIQKESDRVFQVGQALKITVLSDRESRISDDANTSFQIPMSLKPNQPQQLKLEYQWK